MQTNISRKTRTTLTLSDVLERSNMLLAMERVRKNKGAAGSDNLTIEETMVTLKRTWPLIKEKLLAGKYRPEPVRVHYIPKPQGKGQRMLGIPTVTDRLIQQALLQKLTPIFDPTFSEKSYGFRPGRNAHQAVKKSHSYLEEGRKNSCRYRLRQIL